MHQKSFKFREISTTAESQSVPIPEIDSKQDENMV